MAEQVICDRCRKVIDPNKTTRTILDNRADKNDSVDFCGRCLQEFKRWMRDGEPLSEG